jgi:hypothetical protein
LQFLIIARDRNRTELRSRITTSDAAAAGDATAALRRT